MGSSVLNILVYGYYFKGNIGDDLFVEAFRKIFPEYSLIFTDHIEPRHLDGVVAVFFGGGSFLDGKPDITDEALPILLTKKIFYIGVGIETDIHPTHVTLMGAAAFIATRSKNFEKIKSINSNIFQIPDLVYSLSKSSYREKRIDKSILYIPNINVVPQYFDPHWKHISWEYFKLEFAQVLDYLLESGYKVDIFPMCKDAANSDANAGTEITNGMKLRQNLLIDYNGNFVDFFTKYSLVITQRYHGIILAELARTPYISIYHHDKLRESYFNDGSFLSYYNSNKTDIIFEINKAFESKYSDILPIENNIFRKLEEQVSKALLG